MSTTRRDSIKVLGGGLAGLGLMGLSNSFLGCQGTSSGPAGGGSKDVYDNGLFFKISLAQWSLHRAFLGDSLKKGFGAFFHALQSDPSSVLQGNHFPGSFPRMAKTLFGIEAVEFVNTFYFDKVGDSNYFSSIKENCSNHGVTPLLFMCDALGDLGDLDDAKRNEAVEKHYPWVEAAKLSGCHSIRVNAAGNGTADEVKSAAVDGLGKLTEYGEANEINIIVENHGGYSSNGQWLADVLKQVDNPFCGSLPDFGNFCIKRAEDFSCLEEYDRYQGVEELMPYAKGVSAKTNDFDNLGNELNTDYKRMLQIVKESGYRGYIGIEYEGSGHSEPMGIKISKHLLERIGKEVTAS